jgi:hypothetical protein
MGNTLRTDTITNKTRPASQAGRHAGQVFFVYVFSLVRRVSVDKRISVMNNRHECEPIYNASALYRHTDGKKMQGIFHMWEVRKVISQGGFLMCKFAPDPFFSSVELYIGRKFLNFSVKERNPFYHS